jgi:hypothetical protein
MVKNAPEAREAARILAKMGGTCPDLVAPPRRRLPEYFFRALRSNLDDSIKGPDDIEGDS